MDDNEYRRNCARPDVMRRSDLRATIARLVAVEPELTARVAALLSNPPVPKPVGHDGGADDDFLWLELAEEDLDAIVATLGELEAELAASDVPSALLAAAADLLDRWNVAESARPTV